MSKEDRLIGRDQCKEIIRKEWPYACKILWNDYAILNDETLAHVHKFIVSFYGFDENIVCVDSKLGSIISMNGKAY